MRHGSNYDGWAIRYEPGLAIVNRWTARKCGVTLRAGTTDCLATKLVRYRNEDAGL